jgi:hypothetical protein
MTLNDSLKVQSFIDNLNSLNLEDCFKVLDSMSVKELYKELLQEEVNPLAHMKEVQPRQFVSLSIKDIDIPNNLKLIGSYGFSDSSIESLVVPNTVKIGFGAFHNCRQLVDLDIDCGTIGAYSFNACEKLSSVSIGNHVIAIDDKAFCNCSIKNIVIPENVQYIGHRAFYGNPLSVVTIEGKDTAIYDHAFKATKPVIRCHRDSAAERYAKKFDIRVEYI